MDLTIGIIIFIGIALFLLNAYVIHVSKQERLLQQEKEARLRAIRMSNIDHMNGIEFEKYVAWLLTERGYGFVEVTKGSGDFGVDILATYSGIKYAIQVKRYSSNVSRQAVSDAVAGKPYYLCTGAMVVTNSFFTKQAKSFAASVNCELVDRDILVSWIQECCPVNGDHLDSTKAVNSIPNVASTANTVSIPNAAMQQIQAFAEKSYPDSSRLQQYCIGWEVDAYLDLRKLKKNSGIPRAELQKIYAKSLRENQGSYSGILQDLERVLQDYKISMHTDNANDLMHGTHGS